MWSECHGANCFFPLAPAQNLAHRARQVVVPQDSEDTSKIIEGRFVRFQKCLLRRSLIGAMKSSSTGHTATGEDLRFLPLLSEQDPGFVPINLGLLSPLIGLRNVDFTTPQSHLLFALAHIPADSRFGDLVALFPVNPDIDAMCGVPLFARRLTIRLQNLIDEGLYRAYFRPAADRVFALRRQGLLERLPDLAPMHSQFPGHSFDRPHPVLILASDFFK